MYKSNDDLCEDCKTNRSTFWVEEIFIILVDIYLESKDKFRILIQMLGGSHSVKCVKYCIKTYIQGPGIEKSLWQTNVFDVDTISAVDTILNGIHYE